MTQERKPIFIGRELKEEHEMKSIWYNNQKVCDLTQVEYDALCLLLPYWGLQISDDEETVSGALTIFTLGIQGLSHQKLKELERLLQHTGIKIITDDHLKCDQRFYVDFYDGHPMPLALNTPDKQLYYLNPANSFRLPVQTAIHKGITLKRKDGPLFLAVKPASEDHITEWISYLVIQSFLRFSFESLTSITEEVFIACAEKLLLPVNPSFAAVQLPQKMKNTEKEIKSEEKKQPKPIIRSTDDKYYNDKKVDNSHKKLNSRKIPVPPIRPFSSSGSLITKQVPKTFEQDKHLPRNVQPINPFKARKDNEEPIQPFKPDLTKTHEKSVIRPFQTNQNTPSVNQEYNDKASRIFNQRRDGK